MLDKQTEEMANVINDMDDDVAAKKITIVFARTMVEEFIRQCGWVADDMVEEIIKSL